MRQPKEIPVVYCDRIFVVIESDNGSPCFHLEKTYKNDKNEKEYLEGSRGGGRKFGLENNEARKMKNNVIFVE